MAKVHTHYDNLRVTRDAPLEVIKAAYRALAQKHHPDVSASPDSLRVMKIINEAWEVLSDPLKRAEHDAWIAHEEGGEQANPTPGSHRSQSESGTSDSDSRPTEQGGRHSNRPGGAEVAPREIGRSRIGNRTLAFVAIGFVLFVAVVWRSQPGSTSTPAAASLADGPSVTAAADMALVPPAVAERPSIADQLKARQSASSLVMPDGAKPPRPTFASEEDRLAYLQWLGVASQQLRDAKPEHQTRIEFLETVWYESRRAGLQPTLVLGLIEVASGFRKYAIAPTGARGYMQVGTRIAVALGAEGESRLFHLQTNIRIGSVALRMYLQRANGDVRGALVHYYLGAMDGSPTNRGAEAFASAVLAARMKWNVVAPVPTRLVPERESPIVNGVAKADAARRPSETLLGPDSKAPPDREQQSATGYMPNEPRLANAGLSSFTVDNGRGSGDAVARLYLNGTKPAVRSMFVKRGDTFTAASLSPGSYVFRYRYMGSE